VPEEKTRVIPYEWKVTQREPRRSILPPLQMPQVSFTAPSGAGISASTVAWIAGGTVLFGGLLYLLSGR
jgi:hypothetical protein